MKYIKVEDKHWNKQGRICYVNPYQVSEVHWPASAVESPTMVRIGKDWKMVLDQASLALLVGFLDDSLMTESRRKDLLDIAVKSAKQYQSKESDSEKKADEEEDAD